MAEFSFPSDVSRRCAVARTTTSVDLRVQLRREIKKEEAKLKKKSAKETGWCLQAVQSVCGRLVQPLLQAEEGRASGGGGSEVVDPLVGRWIDVSVDPKNYAEYFDIYYGKKQVDHAEVEGYFYAEVDHAGKTHEGQLKDTPIGKEVVLPHRRTVRFRRDTDPTRVEDLTEDLVWRHFEYRPTGKDAWVSSQAFRYSRALAPLQAKPRVCTKMRMLAVFLMAAMAGADAIFFKARGQSLWTKEYDQGAWQPLAGCLMPAPQPFYLEAGGGLARTVVTCWLMPMEPVQSWTHAGWNKLAYGASRLYLVYSAVSLPVSLLASLWHYDEDGLDEMCLSAMLVNSPYILNTMQFTLQYLIGREYVKRMKIWARGAKHKGRRWSEGRGACVETRQSYLRCVVWIHAVCVGLPTIGILCAYVIPGTWKHPALLWQPLLAVSLGIAISLLLGAAELVRKAWEAPKRGEYASRVHYLASRAEYTNKTAPGEVAPYVLAQKAHHELQEISQHEEHAAKYGWTWAALYFMPVMVAIRVSFEVTFNVLMHMTAGNSVWDATQLAWSERRLVTWLHGLHASATAALYHFWSLSQLVLEWL